jgi:hypothetical protein
MGLIKKFSGKVKKFVDIVKLYGDPSEKTIIIPSVATSVLAHNVDIGRVDLNSAVITSVAICFICGLWLGVASEKVGFIKIVTAQPGSNKERPDRTISRAL